MHLPSSTLAWGLLAGAAHAQTLINELSFGHDGRIAPENSRTIPNFELEGKPHIPEILSNKLILTPAAPAPGGQRGAVWSDRKLDVPTWIADVDLRVSGPERGGGNVNIWLVKDGQYAVGTSSVYTVGRFEGLVLVLDTSGPTGTGALRGYLNDGTKEYRALTGIDGLAFGHCEYAYRNLGRPSQIKIRQTERSFQVDIDDKPCFGSDSIVIPMGYHFGITAASADNPDSAEIFKLVVLKTDSNSQQQQQQQQQGGAASKGKTEGTEVSGGTIGGEESFGEDIPDADPSVYASSDAQFADLHNRLQDINHHLTIMFHKMATTDAVGEHRHEEISIQLGALKDLLSSMNAKLDRLGMIEAKVEKMERDMKQLNVELRKSMSNTEKSLLTHVSGNLAGHHDKLAEELRHPGHMRLILVIISGQIFLVVSYFMYKRHKANSPKKYL
ncbi:lectin family integral membrane [Grosmannia clavigera kw1407]|uniref:Lectin family integral membrane n=1 Tax=Grosmannia clavigera (strain kw1407 / UAMH 11150) TaxID=655863 RepID=F0XFA2_GROCL|nr:lectin family integral membrane [Grosmannia clavigera kw1407]EFX04601.1 lectin family integral membrane [Grosmannia clavigera kw1407]